MEVAGTVVAEAAASTVAEGEAAILAEAEVGLDRVSGEAHVPVAQAALAGLLPARSGRAGLGLTVIELTAGDRMECTAAEAWAPQVRVTAQCRGTEPIQG
jgi:hypothetical protein